MDALARKAVKIEAQNAELIRKSKRRKRLETVTRVINGETKPGCGKKTKSGKHRKHTPYTSEAQATAGNIALAVRKGKLPKSKLKGASGQMARGMTMDELESHSKEAKGKKLPKKKRQSNEGKLYVKERRKQRNRRAG